MKKSGQKQKKQTTTSTSSGTVGDVGGTTTMGSSTSTTSTSGTSSSSFKGGRLNIRQNFHEESERALNEQISMCITASYMYESMTFYFYREDVALKGFYKLFKTCERYKFHKQAKMLIKYLTKRGGRLTLKDVRPLGGDEWGTGLQACEKVLELEKKIHDSFLALNELAVEKGDSHLQYFVQEKFLHKQIKWIHKLACHITNLRRVGPGLGEYIYDKHLQGKTIIADIFAHSVLE